MAAKLLAVFVMDRFSDYVSDQMVAPVRESATQTLAALLIHMPTTSVRRVHELLLDMIRQEFPSRKQGAKADLPYVWQVRHAGLLGLKYQVAVREDLIEQEANRDLLRNVVEASLLGYEFSSCYINDTDGPLPRLADADDDVRSAAAGCLLPIVRLIVEYLYSDLPKLLAVLWGCFESMKDDLGSSVSTVMELLGKTYIFLCSRLI